MGFFCTGTMTPVLKIVGTLLYFNIIVYRDARKVRNVSAVPLMRYSPVMPTIPGELFLFSLRILDSICSVEMVSVITESCSLRDFSFTASAMVLWVGDKLGPTSCMMDEKCFLKTWTSTLE